MAAVAVWPSDSVPYSRSSARGVSGAQSRQVTDPFACVSAPQGGRSYCRMLSVSIARLDMEWLSCVYAQRHDKVFYRAGPAHAPFMPISARRRRFFVIGGGA